jgi:hypothetical protein
MGNEAIAPISSRRCRASLTMVNKWRSGRTSGGLCAERENL